MARDELIQYFLTIGPSGEDWNEYGMPRNFRLLFVFFIQLLFPFELKIEGHNFFPTPSSLWGEGTNCEIINFKIASSFLCNPI